MCVSVVFYPIVLNMKSETKHMFWFVVYAAIVTIFLVFSGKYLISYAIEKQQQHEFEMLEAPP